MGNTILMSAEQVYDNCLLSAAAHAVFVLKHPIAAYEQSWDGDNYSFVYGTTRGTISFDRPRGILAGAAREDESQRRALYPQFNAMELFEEGPAMIVSLAEQEATQYLFDEIGGVEKPVVTTAFWGMNGELFLPDGRVEFLKNGGEFPSKLFSSPETLWKYWREQYALSADELALADYIHESRRAGKITLSKKEMDRICKIWGKEPGYQAYLESLAEMGLSVER